jgi:hypothetical protein
MRTELGVMRWEGIGHLLSDGDYLGFNESNYRGAIAEYEKAWNLLDTPWQRQTGGADILEGIADFALRSGDPKLARETLDSITPRAAQIASRSLRAACNKLTLLAAEHE